MNDSTKEASIKEFSGKALTDIKVKFIGACNSLNNEETEFTAKLEAIRDLFYKACDNVISIGVPNFHFPWETKPEEIVQRFMEKTDAIRNPEKSALKVKM